MIGAFGETILSRRAMPQPHPEINRGGDCGACVLSGALGLQVADVYRLFDSEGITNGGEMARCLRCAALEGHADRILDTPAEWPADRHWRAFGSPAHLEHLAWFNYVRMAIDAGYYGLTSIDFRGDAYPDTNHWVLICGAKTQGPVPGKRLTGEILVSCSVRGEAWYEAMDFLKTKGGYDVLFVRPIRN